MSEHVVVTRADGLLTLRINRPEKKNALTRAMYSAMAEALLAADAEPEVRAVLITGGAECFTSGNDVADFLQAPPVSQDSPVFHFMRALFELKKPIVAAVAGAASASPTARHAAPHLPKLPLIPRLLPMSWRPCAARKD